MSEQSPQPGLENPGEEPVEGGSPSSPLMPMQEFRGHIRLISAVFAFLMFVLIASLLSTLDSVFKPVFVAVFLSYLILPVVNGLERLKIPRVLAYVTALAGIFTFLYLLGLLTTVSIQKLLGNLESYQRKLEGYARELEAMAIRYQLILPDQQWSVQDTLGVLPGDAIAGFVGDSTSLFFNLVANLVTVIFFMIFMLYEAERFSNRIQKAFEPSTASRILEILKNINASVQSYMFIKVVISLITAVTVTVVLAIVDLDLLLFIGVLTFVLNFIPYLGSILATALPTTIALVQFQSPLSAVWLWLVLVGVQLGIGNLIEPRLQGERLNLSPLLILIVLAFWAWLWGLVGMLLAVPITVSLHIIFGQFDSTRPLARMMSSVKRGTASLELDPAEAPQSQSQSAS